ncbi:progonadoliberin-2 isoform X1 [Lepisosteus oculatus]|uniref:progonadoliberin-2 isoform X1 n=1 Tax=Lepisosteus oculatus TaxID=7918 RepID=UPI003710F568
MLLLLGVLLVLGAQLSGAQHWSHGWYPGGKRELDSLQSTEISEGIQLCEGGPCRYQRPLRKNLLRNLLVRKPGFHLTLTWREPGRPLTHTHWAPV